MKKLEDIEREMGQHLEEAAPQLVHPNTLARWADAIRDHLAKQPSREALEALATVFDRYDGGEFGEPRTVGAHENAAAELHSLLTADAKPEPRMVYGGDGMPDVVADEPEPGTAECGCCPADVSPPCVGVAPKTHMQAVTDAVFGAYASTRFPTRSSRHRPRQRECASTTSERTRTEEQ